MKTLNKTIWTVAYLTQGLYGDRDFDTRDAAVKFAVEVDSDPDNMVQSIREGLED